MTSRPMSRPRRRILTLADNGQLRTDTAGKSYATDGCPLSRLSLASCQRRGFVLLNVQTSVYFLTDAGREALRTAEGER